MKLRIEIEIASIQLYVVHRTRHTNSAPWYSNKNFIFIDREALRHIVVLNEISCGTEWI